MKIPVNNVMKTGFQSRIRTDSPERLSGTKRGARSPESTEEIGPKMRKLKGGERSRL